MKGVQDIKQDRLGERVGGRILTPTHFEITVVDNNYTGEPFLLISMLPTEKAVEHEKTHFALTEDDAFNFCEAIKRRMVDLIRLNSNRETKPTA